MHAGKRCKITHLRKLTGNKIGVLNFPVVPVESEDLEDILSKDKHTESLKNGKIMHSRVAHTLLLRRVKKQWRQGRILSVGTGTGQHQLIIFSVDWMKENDLVIGGHGCMSTRPLLYASFNIERQNGTLQGLEPCPCYFLKFLWYDSQESIRLSLVKKQLHWATWPKEQKEIFPSSKSD